MQISMGALTWQEFEKIRSDAVFFLPTGSIEQHGPHLPLSSDTIIAYNISMIAAKEVNGIVAPPVNYGYKSMPESGGGPLFPGSMGIDGKTYTLLIKDIILEFIRNKIKKILILNAHYENLPFILEALDLVYKEVATDAKVIVINWWDLVSDETIKKVFNEVPFPGWELEHAAITETSLLLKFAPYLVHMDRLVEVENVKPPKYHLYPITKIITSPSGMLATARTSSKEKGDIIVNEVVEKIKEIIVNNFK